MTAKEYLSQLREVKRQQRILQEEIDELTIKAGYSTGRRMARNISGTDHHCRMEDAVLRKLELLDELEESLAEQDELERSIMRAINEVPDKVCQSVLLMRYVRCYRWEQIAENMNHSLDHIYKLHGKALLSVNVKTANNTNIG
jgi:DNA-directed RNA polymerase specialized sigma24 family protein